MVTGATFGSLSRERFHMDPHLYPEVYADNLFVDVMTPVQAGSLHDLDHFKHFAAEDLLVSDDPDAGWASAHFFMSGVYKTAWRHVYPELYEYYEYLLNEKEDFSQLIAPVFNNICININVPLYQIEDPSGAGRGLLPMPQDDEITTEPRFGRYENNRYIDFDPGFADYSAGNIQLTEAAAKELGLEWVDLSKIGAKR